MSLINLRKLAHNNHTIRQQLVSGKLIKLAPEMAMDREKFENLKPWEQAKVRDRAVVLSATKAVLCSVSAARYLNLSLLDAGRNQTVELSYVNGTYMPPRKRTPDNVIYRRSLIRLNEVYTHEGIRATKLVRTLIDVARYHGVTEGVVAMDSAVKQYDALTRAELVQQVSAYSKLRGIGRARTAAQLTTGNVDSPLETLFRLRLLDWNHPLIFRIEEQVRITLANGEYVIVDYLINGWLVVELDGEFKYDGVTFGVSTQQTLRNERLRENTIQQTGRIVVRFTFPDLKIGAAGSSRMRVVLDELLKQWGSDGPGQAVSG